MNRLEDDLPLDWAKMREALNTNFRQLNERLGWSEDIDPNQAIEKLKQELEQEMKDTIYAVITPEMSPLEVTNQVQQAKTDSRGVKHTSLSERILAEVSYLEEKHASEKWQQVATTRGLFFTDYLSHSRIKTKKNIFCVGDSVTLGAHASKNYGQYLADATGAQVTNYAVSGVPFSDHGEYNIYRQALQVKGADLVIVQTSDDDWLGNYGIGDNQHDVKTVYGAFVQAILALRRNNPKAELLVMTPTRQCPTTPSPHAEIVLAQYILGADTIFGNYTGDIDRLQLWKDGKQVSEGGTLEHGEFYYWVDPKTVSAHSRLELIGLDMTGKEVAHKQVVISPPDTVQEVLPSLETLPGVYVRLDTDKNALGYTLEDYVQAIKLACSPLHLPVIDTFHWDVFDPQNPAFRKAYMSDGLHPNRYGHELVYHKVLETYYRFYDQP